MRTTSKFLNPRERYLQLAFNNTLEEARTIIAKLPVNEKIIIEVGTPVIKRYGVKGIRQIRDWCVMRQQGISLYPPASIKQNQWGIRSPNTVLWQSPIMALFKLLLNTNKQTHATQNNAPSPATDKRPYIVADLKTIDRGATEVAIAVEGGARAAIASGNAPIETLNAFIAACEENYIDAMIDMMNIEFPIEVLRKLKKLPAVVILHRGVDEECYNKEKKLPLHHIQRIKGTYGIMVAVAGGDTPREVQSVIFNDADIAVIWKSVYAHTDNTLAIVEGFLKEIK